MCRGRLRRSCRASRSRCRPLICRDAATSWTRAASAGLPAAGRAGARGDWRSLTDVDDLEHPKPQAAWRFSDSTGCRHGGLIGWHVYKKVTNNTVVAYFPDTLALPFDPLGHACSGASDAPDELVGQCLLKLGILCVAAIFPAG